MTVPSSDGNNPDTTTGSPSDSDNAPVAIPIEKPAIPHGGNRRRIAPKKPISPFKKILFSLTLFICIYSALGFFVAPLLITTFVTDSLEKKINRPVTIATAKVNPFSFEITLKNGIIGAEKNNTEDDVDPVFSFGRLKVKLQPSRFFTSNFVIQAIHGNSVFLHVVRDKKNEINVSALFSQMTGSTTPDVQALTTNLQHIDITLSDTKLLFDDKQSGKTHTVNEISLRLPSQENKTENPYFSASINGSPIEFGEYSGHSQTGEQQFSVQLKDINLPSYLNYLPNPFPHLFSKGKADLNINITTGYTDNTFTLTTSGTGVAHDLWINDGKESHNKIDSASFSFTANIIDKTITFNKIILENPEIHISKNKEGQFFFPAKEAFTNQESSKKIKFKTIVINKGQLVFIDQNVSGGFGASFNDVNVSIEQNEDLTTSSYALNCITNRKTRIATQGSITHENWKIKGLLILNDLPLQALNSYLTVIPGLSVTSGIVNKFETSFTLMPLASPQVTNLTDASALIDNLSLSLQGKEIITLPSTQLSNAQLSNKNHTVSIGNIQLTNGRFQLDANNPFQSPQRSSDQKPLQLTIQKLQIDNGIAQLRGFAFQDKPQTIVISSLSGTNLSSDPTEKAEIITSLKVLKSATIAAQGTVQFNPFQGKLSSEIKDISLVNVPAPLVQWLKPPILNGSLSAKGIFTFPHFTFNGSTSISQLKLRYGAQHEILNCKQLNIDQGTFSLSPAQIKIDKAQIIGLETGLSISQKRLFNTEDFFIDLTSSEIKKPTQVSIKSIVFSTSAVTLHDPSITPPFSYLISDMNGTINSINTQGNDATTLHVYGAGLNQTRLQIVGTTTLFTPHFKTDLAISIQDFPLTDIKPFIEPIMGYSLRGGLFNLDVHYSEDNGSMTGQTNLDIRHLTLGTEPKGNAHFPDIIALLTDAEHHIQLDMPLSGNTTDPSYTFHSAYGKKLREFSLATMVAPYTALSDFFPDKLNPPKQVIFTPGSATPAPDQEDIFSAIQSISQNRPLLHITLAGCSGSVEDRATLLAIKKSQQNKKDTQHAITIGDATAKNYGQEQLKKPALPLAPVLPPKIIRITKQELQELALERSFQIKHLLINTYHVREDILHIDTTPTVVPQSDTGTEGHRVDLILSENPSK